MIRHQNRLHLRINIPGSFQANLSSGESIPGLSIRDLAIEFLKSQIPKGYFNEKENCKHNFSTDLQVLEMAELDRDLLMNHEVRLWEAGINRPAGGKTKRAKKTLKFMPSVEKLILIRNRTGLSSIKYFLETLIISQKLNNLR
jgi:hypothetical protein